MARDINSRLSQLQRRRQGLDRLTTLSASEQREILAKSMYAEAYQSRAQTKPYTRYALGAMQEVGPDFTRISLEEAQRVGRQLASGLPGYGISVDFRLQGSVPANIHIRSVSDVDLLVLDIGFHTYDTSGRKSQLGHYNNPISYTPLSALHVLRLHSESILKDKFPAADVDTTGGKAIRLSGGSLRRPVDVVPSHWHDTTDYQLTQQEHDRGIYIFDKKIPDNILNMPFRHIQRIHLRDIECREGLKKAIRLCKNVKADAEAEGKPVSLPSFDIAAAMWHADQVALAAGVVNELSILQETQRHLDALSRNHALARTLLVPDGTRAIFDTAAKLTGLATLSAEMDDLAVEVAKEQNVLLSFERQPSWFQIDEALRKAYIPAA